MTSLAWLGGACQTEPKPPPATAPTPPAPAAPVAAPAPPDAGAAEAPPAKLKMIANPDGLSLAERMAKRKAAEEKLANENASAEYNRLLKYDRSKLALHTQVFTFIKKTRGQYDALEKKLTGVTDKDKIAVAIEKLRGSLEKPIAATAKKAATIDPKGGNSNVTTDYDVMLHALSNDYPTALAVSLGGDKGPLTEQQADLEKRTVKVEGWLDQLKKKK